jgi:hypothetical protein
LLCPVSFVPGRASPAAEEEEEEESMAEGSSGDDAPDRDVDDLARGRVATSNEDNNEVTSEEEDLHLSMLNRAAVSLARRDKECEEQVASSPEEEDPSETVSDDEKDGAADILWDDKQVSIEDDPLEVAMTSEDSGEEPVVKLISFYLDDVT